MNKVSPLLRRCLFLPLLALMVTSDSIAQRFEPRIIFASNRNGNWDIFSMDVKGKNLVQLTEHEKSDEDPACSPDGRRIVFRSERDFKPDLYVMDRDGNNVIRLTNDNDFESRPSWSPDGTRIAFSAFRFLVGNSEIYVMDAEGNDPINLTKHEMDDSRPSWSPDGSAIAFSSKPAAVIAAAAFNIFVMNADGKARRNLTGDTNLTNSGSPTWSPDGKKIAFSAQHNHIYGIYVMTAEGKKLEMLSDGEGNNRRPAYSPDGTKIAFDSDREGSSNLYLMDTNGRNVVKLTRTPAGTANRAPSWLFPGAFAVNPNGKLSTSWGTIKLTGNR